MVFILEIGYQEEKESGIKLSITDRISAFICIVKMYC